MDCKTWNLWDFLQIDTSASHLFLLATTRAVPSPFRLRWQSNAAEVEPLIRKRKLIFKKRDWMWMRSSLTSDDCIEERRKKKIGKVNVKITKIVKKFNNFQFTNRTVVVVASNHLSIRYLVTQAVSRLIWIHRHVENITWMWREMSFDWRLLDLNVFLQKFCDEFSEFDDKFIKSRGLSRCNC